MSELSAHWPGGVLDLAVRRSGVRTRVTVLRNGAVVAEGAGLVRVLLPLEPETGTSGPTVLALAPFPGRVSRAILLIPREADAADDTEDAADPTDKLPAAVAKVAGLVGAQRVPFEPAPGTFAARALAFQRSHPRLWASRHVVLATGRVLAGLLGIALLLHLVVQRVLAWLAERLPAVGLPSIPWPDIDLPSIPWPDIDLPDVHAPGWLVAVLASAKFWVPILVATVLAVREARRRTRDRSRDAAGVHAAGNESREDDAPDAHR